MKPLFFIFLLLLLSPLCLDFGGKPAPIATTSTTTTTVTTTTTTTTATEPTTTSTSTTTLRPQCFLDEECGRAGWCRQGVCCGSFDSCGYDGACFSHNFLRFDGERCWNGMWLPATTTTVTTTTTSLTTTTIGIPKRADGEECFRDSECASGICMGEVCCSRGQCSYAKKCYNAGQTRVDGRICQSDGSWKKPWGESCFVSSDCVTGNCVNNVCCNSDQCGDGSARVCFNLGQYSLDQSMVCMMGVEGKVGWKRRDGQSCSVDSNCASDNCADGVCCLMNYCGYGGRCYANGASIDYGSCVNGTWKEAG